MKCCGVHSHDCTDLSTAACCTVSSSRELARLLFSLPIREAHGSAPSGMKKQRKKKDFVASCNVLSHLRVCLHLQSRSPKHGPNPQPGGVGDQVDHLSLASLESLDTMSEADTPSGFTRGTRIRASLPVVRSTNQTKDRSLGMTATPTSFPLFGFHAVVSV